MKLNSHPKNLDRPCRRCGTVYPQPGICPKCEYKTYFARPDGECSHSVEYSADGWRRHGNWIRTQYKFCPSCGEELAPMPAPQGARLLQGVCPSCGGPCHQNRHDVPAEDVDQSEAIRHCVSCGAFLPEDHMNINVPTVTPEQAALGRAKILEQRRAQAEQHAADAERAKAIIRNQRKQPTGKSRKNYH